MPKAPHLALLIAGRRLAAGPERVAAFAAELRRAVAACELSRADLAAEADMTLARLVQLENGGDWPDPWEVESLAAAINWEYWSNHAAAAANRKRVG